jgi:cell division protease FtsH
MFAVYEGRDYIGRDDMIKACIKVHFPCLIADAEAGSISWTERRRVAIHEAGHATATEVLRPGNTTFVAIGMDYRETLSGVTVCKRIKGIDQFVDRQEIRILEGLAGKAAVDLAFGVADLGCNSDIDDAYCTERGMIIEDAIRGFDTFDGSYGTRSEKYKEEVDRKTAERLTKLYEDVKKILAENRPLLDALTDALMESDYLTAKDIAGIKDSLDNMMSDDRTMIK